MFNDIIKITFFFVLVCSLLSCGGGSSVSSVSLEAENTQLLPGGRTTLVAQADDSNPSGDSVSWSFRENNSGAVLDVIDNELDGNHQARAIYIAGNNPGIDVVQVSFKSGAKATVSITVGHGAVSITLQAESTHLPPGGNTNIIATVVTELEETFDAKVSFSFRRNESGGFLDVINSRLDSNGEARAIYTAGSNPGIDVIEASLESGPMATVSITVGHAVGGIRLEQFANTVLATALSSIGLPVPGAIIDFFITAGTIFIDPLDPTDNISATTTALTNENGVTQPVMFTLPSGVNTARVTASSGVVSATLDVVRTSALSTLQTHSLGLSSSQIISSIYFEQKDNTIRAKLRDPLGEPVAGALLSFEVRDGLLDHKFMLTDDDGLAEQMFLLDKDVSQSEIIVEGGGMSATLVVK